MLERLFSGIKRFSDQRGRYEGFQQVGSVDEGQLVFKLPGTDVIMRYSGGTAHVNRGDVGYLALNMVDVNIIGTEAKINPDDDPFNMQGVLERYAGPYRKVSTKLREVYEASDADFKRAQNAQFSSRPIKLLFSQAGDGSSITFLPWALEEDKVKIYGENRSAAGFYHMKDENAPTVETLFRLHKSVVRSVNLANNRERTIRGTLELADSANRIYEHLLTSFLDKDRKLIQESTRR